MHCIIAEKTIALVIKHEKCQGERIYSRGYIRVPNTFLFGNVLHSHQWAYFGMLDKKKYVTYKMVKTAHCKIGLFHMPTVCLFYPVYTFILCAAHVTNKCTMNITNHHRYRIMFRQSTGRENITCLQKCQVSYLISKPWVQYLYLSLECLFFSTLIHSLNFHEISDSSFLYMYFLLLKRKKKTLKYYFMFLHFSKPHLKTSLSGQSTQGAVVHSRPL